MLCCNGREKGDLVMYYCICGSEFKHLAFGNLINVLPL